MSKFQSIIENNTDIKDIVKNPAKFADVHQIQDKEDFVNRVNCALSSIPEETHRLFQRNPLVSDETKRLFISSVNQDLDISRPLPVTVAAVALALTTVVVVKKVVTKS